MTAELKLTRVQEKGQVTLPADIRKRLGLKKGALVAVRETPEGILITPQELVARQALDEIGEALREQGLTLEDMIERGRAIRARMLEEQYGVNSETDAAVPALKPSNKTPEEFYAEITQLPEVRAILDELARH